MQHFIYALTDPMTDVIGYVGRTNDAHSRYKQHYHVMRWDTTPRANWIRELKAKKLLPGLKILEVVEGEEQAKAREEHWIQFYRDQGIHLTNTVLPPRYPLPRPKKSTPKPHPTPPDRRFKETLFKAYHRRKGERGGRYPQVEMAFEVGIAQASLARILHGYPPSRPTLLKICRALRCTVEEADEIFLLTQWRSPSQSELDEAPLACPA